MAVFLEDSEYIAELEAHVQGGRTIAVDNHTELDALIKLCHESRALGLRHVYDWLPRFNEWLNWAQSESPRRRNFESEVDDAIWKHPHNLTATEGLEVSLKWTREMWVEGPDAEGLRLLVSVGKAGELRYEGKTPALFLSQGSINALFTPFVDTGIFSLKLGAFAVGMCVKALLLPSIQAEELVTQLRDHAREKSQFPDLRSLDDLKSNDLKGKRGVIVLLHGLFSTDMATFDGFLEAWEQCPKWELLQLYVLQEKWRALREEPDHASAPSERDFQDAFGTAVKEDYLIVGWPHNTLARIEANADTLSALLVKLNPEVPVVFVCHSRGGLLGRKVAQMLNDREAADWKDRIKLCVTFGTPHEGAELAEHPLKMVAAYLMVMAGTGTVISLARVLAVYRNRKRFDGIEDLRPDSEFFTKLKTEEIKAAPRAKTRALDIHAVGGVFRGDRPFPQVFVSALLGTRDHDLVVRRKSSVPDTFDDSTITACGHGEYFQKKETEGEQFMKIIEQVREVLGVTEAILKRATANPLRGW